MTVYHLLVFGKVVIFGLSQLSLTIMAKASHDGEEGLSWFMFCLYIMLVTTFFYWVYPITIS